MPFCTNCGKELVGGEKFCPHCGTPIGSGAATAQKRRIQEYAGKIIKCPHCGESLASFQTICPTCGYEIRGAGVISVVKELATKLEAIDAQSDPKPKGIFYKKQDPNQLTEKEKRKIDLIRHFPIPNTREDLLEFLILASSNIDTEHGDDEDSLSAFEQALSDAWKAKYDQAYHKAQLSFGDSQEFRKISSAYKEKVEEQKRKMEEQKKTAERQETNEIFLVVFLCIVLIVMVLITAFISFNTDSGEKTVDIQEAEVSEPLNKDDHVTDFVDGIANGIDAGIDAFSSWLDNIGE